jgi:hypothetical protein
MASRALDYTDGPEEEQLMSHGWAIERGGGGRGGRDVVVESLRSR